MLVSVIVPNYNHSIYLTKRLDSILEQTYKDFEIIILDDCSTDNSKEVIRKYANNENVSNIVFNEQNSGSTFKQWEKGFALAKGNLIWIAESDDYCDSSFLSEVVPLFEKDENLAISYCTSNIVDSEGQMCDYKDVAEAIPEKTFVGTDFIKKYMLARNSIWNASAVVFRKQNALSIGKDYMNYVAAGDHLFWIELAETGNVAHISNKLNYFRQHNNKVTPRKVYEGITYKEEYRIFNYLKRKKVVDSIDGIYVHCSYLLNILNGQFATRGIKSELLLLWGYKWWITPFILKIAIKLSLILK